MSNDGNKNNIEGFFVVPSSFGGHASE